MLYRLLAQVLCQDLIILAVGLDVSQTGVEGIQQLLVVSVEDGEAVGGGVAGGVIQNLQGQVAVLMEAFMMGVSSKQPTHWPPKTAWYIVGESSK